MTEVETTPNSRQNYALSLPDFVRENVKAAAPNKDRCLVQNGRPTQLCHCVWRKAMNDDNLVRLYRSRIYESDLSTVIARFPRMGLGHETLQTES